MDLGSALNSIMEYDIKNHCHINSNEDGDRFVGIKADSENAMVYFPIGYALPKTDAEIRTDIKNKSNLRKSAEELVALANERGGGDNITIVALEREKCDNEQ